MFGVYILPDAVVRKFFHNENTGKAFLLCAHVHVVFVVEQTKTFLDNNCMDNAYLQYDFFHDNLFYGFTALC